MTFVKNIAAYMADPPLPSPPPPTSLELQTGSPESTATTLSPTSRALTHNGPKFPPFPRREVDKFVRKDYNSHGRSKTVLTEEEAKAAKENILRLLHDFEGYSVQSILWFNQLMRLF